jgi:predicted PurR-regulated permease PerM
MPLGMFSGRLVVTLLVVVLAVVLWKLMGIIVLIFGAVLLAIGLRAATRGIAQRTGMREAYALVAVVAIGLAIFGLVFWLFGTVIAAQADDLFKVVPAGFKLLLKWLNDNLYGREVLAQIRGMNVTGATGWATSLVTSALGLIVGGLGYTVIIIFAAIYLAAEPDIYRHLCFRLVPPAHRATVERLFDAVGDILQRWLIGQLFVMAVIGVLSGIGLWLLGIKAAFALGLMGGLLCFIPFVGAILAAVPATLVALTQGPFEAACVIAMYIGVHFVEGNFITPLVQAKATSLPPVLAILSTVIFSLLGPMGVLLAAPLTLFFMTVVEILYVQSGLGVAPEHLAPLANSLTDRDKMERPL